MAPALKCPRAFAGALRARVAGISREWWIYLGSVAGVAVSVTPSTGAFGVIVGERSTQPGTSKNIPPKMSDISPRKPPNDTQTAGRRRALMSSACCCVISVQSGSKAMIKLLAQETEKR